MLIVETSKSMEKLNFIKNNDQKLLIPFFPCLNSILRQFVSVLKFQLKQQWTLATMASLDVPKQFHNFQSLSIWHGKFILKYWYTKRNGIKFITTRIFFSGIERICTKLTEIVKKIVESMDQWTEFWEREIWSKDRMIVFRTFWSV